MSLNSFFFFLERAHSCRIELRFSAEAEFILKMETCRPCGCKGIRTCLLCEEKYDIKKYVDINKENGTYVYCPDCAVLHSGWCVEDIFSSHFAHTGVDVDFQGIHIEKDFLDKEEEEKLISGINLLPWQVSQSGRRKQNFGPKCNFKKRKIQLGDFEGFPAFSKFVQDKFSSVNVLRDFKTIEQCSLEYNPVRGASIDPHIDDCWIWGERIVTVNLLADSVLTMTYNKKHTKYNLELVSTYPSILNENGLISNNEKKYLFKGRKEGQQPIIRIPMPRRSLLVMYGEARYEWEHQILREDIKDKRICLAYREFTPPFLEGGDSYDIGKSILKVAQNFF